MMTEYECELIGTNPSVKKQRAINTDKEGTQDKRCQDKHGQLGDEHRTALVLSSSLVRVNCVLVFHRLF